MGERSAYLLDDLFYFVNYEYKDKRLFGKNADGFFIGYEMEDHSLKDVTTGEICNSNSGNLQLSHLVDNFDFDINNILGIMTGWRASDANFKQRVIALLIESKITKVMSVKDIAWIKKIINKEIINCHNNRLLKEMKKENKDNELQEKYGITDEERTR